MTTPFLTPRTLGAAAKRRLAASSVAPVASGYERSLRPCLALVQHTPATRRHSGMSSERMRRVNEAIREVLSESIGTLKDPRIGFVTVTGVKTSPDLRQATVYVSVLGSKRKRQATLQGLESSHGVLQAAVNRELHLKRTPQLSFEYDPTIEQGVRLTRLIDELAPDGNPDS